MRTNMSVEEFKKLTAEQKEEAIAEKLVMGAEDFAVRIRDFLANVKIQNDEHKADVYADRIKAAFVDRLDEYKCMSKAEIFISMLKLVTDDKIG